MRRTVKLTTLISLLIISPLLGIAVGFAQNGKPSPPSTPQERERRKSDGDDKVYTAKEVDVKAKVTNRMENLPASGSDCPVRGRVTLRAILHKSGKVTEVVLVKGLGCSYDQAAMDVVRKYKFTPAIKDGHPVSQYSDIEYEYKRY